MQTNQCPNNTELPDRMKEFEFATIIADFMLNADKAVWWLISAMIDCGECSELYSNVQFIIGTRKFDHHVMESIAYYENRYESRKIFFLNILFRLFIDHTLTQRHQLISFKKIKEKYLQLHRTECANKTHNRNLTYHKTVRIILNYILR